MNQVFSVNAASNPAEKGSIIQIFATGEGQTDPGGVDARLATSVLPKPLLPVSVRIGGIMADVVYAGAAPDLVAGVIQVNARVPAGVASGAVPVTIIVGTQESRAGVTVAIR